MTPHPIVHVEIPSKDPAVNAKFYGDLFGWKLEKAPDFDYWQFDPESGPGGGFPGLNDEQGIKAGDVIVYIGTDDIPASLARAEQLGGKTLVPETEIPGIGYFAWFTDPSGNRLALYRSMNPPASGG
jgi:predicted enzyme related to lactoylglutathione lyase